ncbi:unnamed protein product [Fraxinus pennsylvanica]|uniref:Uncharacterized protein n=1 Tax=Fraxinus pennsylvanica TaxID=56036 RepID=A0AAD1Z4C4_9LAMI|nr:unnamed protein product [Fraxinus pennsylvanica]
MLFHKDVVPIFFKKQQHPVVVCASRRTLLPGSGVYSGRLCFGDSLADTGNLLHSYPPGKHIPSGRWPYGETFFHHPTGRFSDGRLIIDFIAQSLGLPFLEPFIGREKNENTSSRDFRKGVNFAVAGATALDVSFLEKYGIFNHLINVSLSTQLDWFKEYFARQIQELIKLEARTVMSPGNLPIGCLPYYLSYYENSNEKEYDPKTGCLNWLNRFSEYHNELLQKELNRLRGLYPHATIIYGDYYNAAMCLLSFSKQRFTSVVRACCGAGGPDNYNASTWSSYTPATNCDDPSKYVSWDGIHFTEAAYRWIAQGLLEGPYTNPHIRTVCTEITRTYGLSEY